ncbi:MAG TPA: hypothetical protein VF176_03785 [Solirubrobacterales bacterium]
MTRVFRAAALVVTDRRWAATLSATALGFGLFIGVAIGPGAAGTLATGVPQVIDIPTVSGVADSGSEEAPAAARAAPATGSAGSEATHFPSAGTALPSYAPIASAPGESAPGPASPPAAPKVPAAPTDPVEHPDELTLTGTVVHDNPAAGSYALAIAGGELVPVHTAKLPDPGEKLSVVVRRLANGTFAEAARPEESGAATRATFNGTITYIDPTPESPAYTVSGRGASLLVHVHPDPTGAGLRLPALGAYATVAVDIEQPTGLEPTATLWQHEIDVVDGAPSTYLDLAGTVEAILPEVGQILFSADDAREGEADLTLTVPRGISSAKLKLNDSYLATATVEEDGTLTLAGIAGDEHTEGAEDSSSAQGDLKRSLPTPSRALPPPR